MALHKNLAAGDIHIPYQWVYADQTARTGATGFVAGDVGKLARQLDDNTLWILTAVTPAWVAVGGGGGGGVPTSRIVGTQNGLQGGGDLTADRTLSPVYGSSANTVCAGNDARLSDNRTDANAIHGNVSAEISAVTEKTTPVAADLLLIEDSAASNAKKRVAVGNLPSPTPVFGADFQEEVSAVRSTTTSTTFQDKLTLTTPSLTGKYRVAWHAVVDQSSAADAVQVQLYNDTDAGVVGVRQEHEPKDSNNRIAVGGFEYIDFTGAAKSFTIQYRQQRGSTAGIQDAHIEIWRVS